MAHLWDLPYDTPTELCWIMGRNGSDKGHKNIMQSRHNYTVLYNHLFSALRTRPIRLFEVGLGTNNTRIPSNMGPYGRPGASLYGWSEYFHQDSQIFGADIDDEILFQEGNIRTYFCDQTKPDVIKTLWEHPDLQEGFDIIIDDGLHEFEANCTLFENSVHKLKPGGYYIIEDIYYKYIQSFLDKQKEWEQRYPHLTFTLTPLPNSNPDDNTLMVVHYRNT